MTDLVILGAGPAGLGAAFKAAQAGYSVQVIERAGRVGGAAGSFEIGGMRVDVGSHRLHPSIDERILEDIAGLLGPDLQKRSRNGRIRLMDRWIAFPLRSKDLVKHMPRSFVAGAIKDALTSPLRRPRAETFEEVLRAGLGPTICERFYFPYARKIWGLEPSELSAEQARRRVTADSPLKIASRVLRGSGSGGERGSSYFWYPKRGYGQISEALADGATREGADILLGTTATSVRQVGDGVEIETDSGSLQASKLFSTIPVTVLARLLDPPADVKEAASRLVSRAMLLVYLVLEVDRYTDFDAHYLPEATTPVTRISEPKNYREGDDPCGRTVLCAEIPCSLDEEIWVYSDEPLRDVVVDGLKASGLPDVSPVDVHVERLPFAYPIYTIDHERHLASVDRWVASHDRILTFGRQGLFAHDNAHHALSMAYAAVDCLRPDGGFDLASWRLAREGFAQHVVED